MFFLKKSLPGAIYCQTRLQQLPTIPVDVSSYNILETPHRCFNRILELIASAKERILITALYLQDDEIGRQVLQALYDAKEKNPKLYIRVYVDFHRAQREMCIRDSFNIHCGFDMQKKKDIVELLEKEKCPFDEDKLDTIEEYNKVRRFAVDNNNDYLDSRIRKLQEYSEISITPGPHYALGVENYATWTSPIRKYGDMVNHRLIKSLIANTVKPTLPDEDLLKEMNDARRTNRMAERDVRDWLYVEFLEPEIEKKTVFNGEIFDISRGGLKVILTENLSLIHI